MEVRDILLFTTDKYDQIEDACDVKRGFLRNRRHKPFNMLPGIVIINIANYLNIDFFDLMNITKDDVEKMREARRRKSKAEIIESTLNLKKVGQLDE